MKKKKTLWSVAAGALLLVSLSFGAGLDASAEPYQENDGSGGKPPTCSKYPCPERP